MTKPKLNHTVLFQLEEDIDSDVYGGVIIAIDKTSCLVKAAKMPLGNEDDLEFRNYIVYHHNIKNNFEYRDFYTELQINITELEKL